MNGIIGLNISLVMAALHCLAYERKKAWIIVQSGSTAARVCRRSRYCEGLIELDLKSCFASPMTGISAIQKVCHEAGINFLVPADMQATYFLADIKNALKGIHVFPSLPSDQLRSLSNKLHFAHLLERMNLPQPKFSEISSEDQLDGRTGNYPIVLKPLDLESSQGVKVCNNPREAASHLRELSNLSSAPYLIQDYIPGIDLDLSIFADSGRVVAWTIHKAWRPPQGPMIYEFVEHAEFLKAGTQLVKELGYCGLIHIDGRLDSRDGSVKMIEANPRVFASMHYSALAGVNFVGVAMDLCFRGSASTSRKQQSGVVHSPLGSLYVLSHPRLRLPVNTKGTRRSWVNFLCDPLPVAMGFFDRKRARADFAATRANLQPAPQ